jgi:hypothetical protein
MSAVDKVRHVKWGCDVDECEAHRRSPQAQVNFFWQHSGPARDRPLLCRLGFHRHWHFAKEVDLYAKQCWLCNYTWVDMPFMGG